MAKKYSVECVAKLMMETDTECENYNDSDSEEYNDSLSDLNSSSACSDSFDSEEEDAGCGWIDEEVVQDCSPMQSLSPPGML